MPQASEELRNQWKHHEEGGGDALAIKTLEAAGYTLRSDWTWTLPTPDHDPTIREIRAMEYLIFEWDFGGIRRDKAP